VEAEIWLTGLKDLTAEQVHAAFEYVERTFEPTSARPFPVIATVRNCIQRAMGNALAVEAESSWQEAMDWVRKWYRPDCRDAQRPKLSEHIWRSLLAAGGPEHVSDCPLDDLAWAKKRFIEAYLSLQQLREDEHFIGTTEAKQILQGLRELGK
jgi:hypothetical protein